MSKTRRGHDIPCYVRDSRVAGVSVCKGREKMRLESLVKGGFGNQKSGFTGRLLVER